MTLHTHDFVENYKGMVGFGYDRETDENTVIYYLQKFSDDTLLKYLIPKMTDKQLDDMFSMINDMLKTHLSEEEYHAYFLKDPDENGS